MYSFLSHSRLYIENDHHYFSPPSPYCYDRDPSYDTRIEKFYVQAKSCLLLIGSLDLDIQPATDNFKILCVLLHSRDTPGIVLGVAGEWVGLLEVQGEESGELGLSSGERNWYQ